VASGDHSGSRSRLIVALVAMTFIVSVIAYASRDSLGDLRTSTTNGRVFPAAADTYAHSMRPNKNFGSRPGILADASPYVGGFLRFEPSGVGIPVLRATLRLFAQRTNAVGIEVRGASLSAWAEPLLTYRSMPAALGVVASSGPITAGTWVELDVTPLVQGNRPVSFAVTTTSITAVRFASRESIHPPQLVVEFGSFLPADLSSPTPASSPTPPRTSVPLTPSAPLTPPPSPSPLPTKSPVSAPTPSPTPPSDGAQPSFPIRAAFYYPWFPEAWKQQGFFPFSMYTPVKGLYDSGSRQVIEAHIGEMLAGKIEAGIASWWGPLHHTDSRIPALLEVAAPTPFRWVLYHEEEGQSDPSVAALQADLAWIQSRYAGQGAYLRVAGRPVLFVYSDPGDGCGMAQRWVEANRTYGFYLVLKVFRGYRDCAAQPDSWHQYAGSVAADPRPPDSYTISPGFWKPGEAPRLLRDLSRWRGNIRDMTASGARWQLIVSWNEWGEGSQVEASIELGDAWLQALATDGVEVSG
jgi:hypothetical protein